ncbi:MAG TPA: FAD-dependent oxidoreductase [Vicinamibacterales bacterium]|nr:FAD-dependent oxidoreductase [Vicinamibacterales bacterium]
MPHDAPDGPAPVVITTRCCITGGGPAGMMAGVLLARAGVDVVVLEKHADFLRDFRGDTVHPSTLQLMDELGWLDGFLARPHQELRRLGGQIGDEHVMIADFTHLPVKCPFIVLMPQWDFLDFLAEHGRRYPGFTLKMRAEVVGLIQENGRVTGVRARTPDGPLEVRAALVIGADGRSSTVRAQAGLEVETLGAPMDVLWMRLSRAPTDPKEALGYIRNGHMLVMIDRGDYWQCGFVIPKGAYEDLRREGLDSLRQTIADVVPFTADRVGELKTWDDISLLTVKVDRLREWARDGLLCIGDAAHAMSPVGGVGINLAIQDAVAASNILASPLRAGRVDLEQLRSVQRRRSFPTRATQRIQVLIQNRVVGRALRSGSPMELPLVARLLRDHPVLRRLPARMVGLGFRPEHI